MQLGNWSLAPHHRLTAMLTALARPLRCMEEVRRQRKRWEDNIREWTGLEFGKSQRAVENREKWKKLVVKLSVVP